MAALPRLRFGLRWGRLSWGRVGVGGVCDLICLRSVFEEQGDAIRQV